MTPDFEVNKYYKIWGGDLQWCPQFCFWGTFPAVVYTVYANVSISPQITQFLVHSNVGDSN